MQAGRNEGWFEKRVRAAWAKDKLILSDRIGEIASMVVILLVVAFFVDHQVSNTGFFTSKFGTLEMILFYGSPLFGVVMSASKLVVGRRNPIRPFDAVGSVLWGVTSFWLLAVFPFNFSHLGDVVPLSLGFLISWIPDILVKAVLLIGGFVGIGQAIYTGALYLGISRMERSEALGAEKRSAEMAA